MEIIVKGRPIIIVLLGIAIFCGFYFFVYESYNDKVDATKTEITMLREELEVLNVHYENLELYNTSIDVAQLYFDAALENYPKGVKEEDFLVWLLNLESATGYDISSVSFEQAEPAMEFDTYMVVDENPQVTPVDVFSTSSTTTGVMSYNQVKDLISYVYDYPMHTLIDTLSISGESEDFTELTVDIRFNKLYIDYPGAVYEQSPMPEVAQGVDDLFLRLIVTTSDAVTE